MGLSSRTQLLLLLCAILSVLALGHAAAAGAVFELAAAGEASNNFGHCLDTASGVSVVATGNVVWPAIVKTVLVPNRPHYTVNMRSVSIAGTTLQLPTAPFYGEGKSVVIDIGMTLIYLPEKVYKATMIEILDKHRDTLFYDIQDLLFFKHYGRKDNVFPEITLHFEGGLALIIYPHDYLLNNGSDWYFVGLRNGRYQPVNLRDMLILGDIVFSNKLVVFDLENQSVGWTDYKCSSGINLEDE